MMESQPQNQEFRNNPENFHSCTLAQGILNEIMCCNSNTKGLTIFPGLLADNFC